MAGMRQVIRTCVLAIAISISVAHMPAFAQVTVLDGKYSDDNAVRVISRVKLPAPEGAAYRIAMLKLATMTGQKGFSRFAVTKIDDCGTISINNGRPIVDTCKIFGKMLKEGEVAEPRGKEAVRYYTILKGDDGIYYPTPEA